MVNKKEYPSFFYSYKRYLSFFSLILLILVLFLMPPARLNAQESLQNNANYFNFGISGLLAVSDSGASFGPGITGSWINPRLFTKWLGMGTYLNLLIPFVDDELGIVASLLLGPSSIVFERGAFSLPVTLGLHFDYVKAFAGRRWGINMGVGAAVDAVYQLGKKWNIFGRVMAVYNFGDGGEFLLIPAIGTGFRF